MDWSNVRDLNLLNMWSGVRFLTYAHKKSLVAGRRDNSLCVFQRFLDGDQSLLSGGENFVSIS